MILLFGKFEYTTPGKTFLSKKAEAF
jgi:hypothetical protein